MKAQEGKITPQRIYQSDEVLLDLYINTGQEKYFNRLYNRHFRVVLKQCWGFCTEEDEAEDLAQEVFVKIHRQLHKFEGKSRFSTWLYQVTRNVCLDYLRKEKHRIRHEDKQVPKELLLEMFEEKIDDEASPLLQELASLPQVEKDILMMKYGFDWPIEDIAAQLDMSIGAIKMRLKRAKEKLRKTRPALFQP